METTIADEIKRDPALAPAVEKADRLLRGLLDGVEQPPSAAWRPSRHQQPAASVELELSDNGDNVARDFRVEHIIDERDFRFALTKLWGDLIMLAYGKSNERLAELLRDIRKDEEKRELQVQGA